MTVYRAPALDKAAPIVDPKTGRITPYFQRFWQNLSFTADTGANQNADISTLKADVTTINGQITTINASKAPLASPAFTGNPTAPTATVGDNDTSIATTAFVQAAIAALVNASPASLDTLKELADALGDDANFATTVTNALALKAALASPGFSGTPTAPTAAQGTSTAQLATTAFVHTESVARATFSTWTAATGTAARTTFATYAAPTAAAAYDQTQMQAVMDHLQVLSQRMKALIDDLKT